MKNRLRNYEIQTKLGSGSYGVIYKALSKATRETCVLKQISLGRLSEKAKKSAINEATIMGKLVHPFIVRYIQSFIEDNTLNIVMQYCDNGDLNHFLKLQNKRPLKEQKIWRFFLQICIGLEYIHQNRILHRDIKSLNIFMNKNEEIKIGDLGVAKMLTSNEFAQTMVGTPFYLSPELCEEKPYNEKSDIWALGCLLYELCTYRHPFEAQNQGSLILKIVRGKYASIPESYSKDLKEIIDLCLERDYKRRPTTGNILSRPKIRELVESLGINKLVEEEMKKIMKEKEIISSIPKALKQEPSLQNKQRAVKIIDTDAKKIIKAVDNEVRPEIKKEQIKKLAIKKEQIVKKQENIKRQQVKREPIVILPKPIVHSERKIQTVDVQKEQNNVKENKNQFISNLEKMIEAEEQKKKRGSRHINNSQPQIKPNVQPQKLSRVAQKVEELKNNPNIIDIAKVPTSNDQKRSTPAISSKKSSSTNDVAHLYKKPDIGKPPLMPNKPPLAPSSQMAKEINKEHVKKVKNEKVIQPKVYDSQKNAARPQGIIKSGGFTTCIQVDRASKDKSEQDSKEKVMSAKRASNPSIKVEKESQKILFGPSMAPSPSVQHKSQHNIKSPPSVLVDEKRQIKKQDINKVSRVRKGAKNELARNARNISRYTEVSKQEQDMVMNLPSKIKNKSGSSSDSQEQVKKQRHIIDDLKRKSNHNKFQLKEINHDLVLQKYQDMLKSEQLGQNDAQQVHSQPQIDDSSEDQLNKQFDEQIQEEALKDKIIEVERKEEDEFINEEMQCAKRNSSKSNEFIEQVLQAEAAEENLQKEQDLDKQFQDEDYEPVYQKKDQWSFDEQPELPMMEEKETSAYFQPNNPYLVEQQQQTTQNKINYLQLKLQENMKRQDQINKLMQIKLDECKKFIGNQSSLAEILEFFRKKLHMDEDYNENDQKEVEVFLKKKGLTDHYKFQNIYKIMHFEMQLENTRKIIQRICKKLSEFEGKS